MDQKSSCPGAGGTKNLVSTTATIESLERSSGIFSTWLLLVSFELYCLETDLLSGRKFCYQQWFFVFWPFFPPCPPPSILWCSQKWLCSIGRFSQNFHPDKYESENFKTSFYWFSLKFGRILGYWKTWKPLNLSTFISLCSFLALYIASKKKKAGTYQPSGIPSQPTTFLHL